MNMALTPSRKKIKTPLEYDHSIEERAEEMMIEETPEMLAAIDEGLESLRRDGSIPFEVVKAQLQKKWGIL